MEPDVEDFLAHYGKKGMKWGVRKNPGGDVKAARKEARSQIRQNFKEIHSSKTSSGGQKVSAGKVAGSFILANATFGGSTGYQVARATGYKKGQALAIGFVGGPIGGVVISELQVRRAANAAVRN